MSIGVGGSELPPTQSAQGWKGLCDRTARRGKRMAGDAGHVHRGGLAGKVSGGGRRMGRRGSIRDAAAGSAGQVLDLSLQRNPYI